jgi:hypothetical protein
MIQVLSAMLFPSQYIFTYLKKFWFVHKCPIVLCRLRMSMDHLEVIMCIYITCLIQSGNTSGIMSSCKTNSNPNKYLKPTFFFCIVFLYFPLRPIVIAGSCCCSVIQPMERLWRILRMGAFKVVEFTQLLTSQQAQIHHQHLHCRNVTTLQGCHPLYQRKSIFSHLLLACVSGYFPADASVAQQRTMCV